MLLENSGGIPEVVELACPVTRRDDLLVTPVLEYQGVVPEVANLIQRV